MAEGVGNAPTSVMPILFSRQVQPACICLPSEFGCQGWIGLPALQSAPLEGTVAVATRRRTNTAGLNRPACYG